MSSPVNRRSLILAGGAALAAALETEALAPLRRWRPDAAELQSLWRRIDQRVWQASEGCFSDGQLQQQGSAVGRECPFAGAVSPL